MSTKAETSQKILVVEDDEGLRRQYRWAFSEFAISEAGSREEATALLRRHEFAIAILDLGLPPVPDQATEGFLTLAAIRDQSPSTKVVVVSGQDSREHALRAVELGAYDFCEKPVDLQVLQLIVERAHKLFDLERELIRLSNEQLQWPSHGIIGSSPEMASILRTIEKIAPTDISVLLLGESGTGKELLARAIHRMSRRTAAPFIPINCAAIPEALLESELFGHERGAFTGAVKQTIGKIELANRGTLFLDEIGDLPLPMQVKLLRFLQDQIVERIGGRQSIQIDVRIIYATNQNLSKLIADGRFREDLFYRINEAEVQIPPLRDRRGDAVLIANYFLKHFASELNRAVRGFDEEALRAIEDYTWRGNVRELENRVKRATIMASGPLVRMSDLQLGDGTVDDQPMSLDLREARIRAEAVVLKQALARTGSNLSQAAKLLGVSRPTLYDLMRAHGINVSP